MGETQEWYGPPIWPAFEKVQGLLERWQRQHPDVMRLSVVTTSAQGRPVYAVWLTDPSASEDDKEHVLITALHAGVERSATTTVLCLIEWLLSGEPLARQILRSQVVVLMPVPHPDGYVAGDFGNIYSGWTLEGVIDPEKMPEAMAVKRLMDDLQPEVHADIHGLSLDFERYTMLENSGSSYSNSSARCYHREVIRQMDEAALAEGFPSDWQESDAERIFWGSALDSMGTKLWRGRPWVAPGIYCYNRYHTMLSLCEIGWERSGLLRHRRLLQIGLETWPGEYYPGYPTRVILSNNYHMLTAYGQSAAARRRSRVELWNKQRQITIAMNDPMVEGKILFACATSPSAANKWLKGKTIKAFSAQLSEDPNINAAPIQRFLAGWPRGQNGPEAFLGCVGGDAKKDAATIEHGISLRLRIFFSKAQITDLRLNGHPVAPGETNGFIQWRARGITYVQINIPPERTKKEEVFVVTCEYDPCERRTRWRGWE